MSQTIIGIDPGSRYTGFGIIKKDGQRLIHLASGRIQALKVEGLAGRLDLIYSELTALMEKHKPHAFAIEKVFHGKNPQSSLILGHARGVAMLVGAQAGLEVFEYNPTEVKNAIVGQGRAEKAQVAGMVKILLNLGQAKMSEDESDALSIAICHANNQQFERMKRANP